MEIKRLEENSNNLDGVRGIVTQSPNSKIRTFAIISPENPLGWKNATADEFAEKYLKYTQAKGKYNAEAYQELKDKLKFNPEKYTEKIENTGNKGLQISGLTYAKIKGKYGDRENSFIIFNLTLSDAKDIAHDFGQESFFFGKLTESGDKYQIGYWETSNSCQTYELIEVTETVSIEDKEAEDFFSKYGLKFRINMKQFGDELPDITNQELFDESLDEDRTFMSRARVRSKMNNEQRGTQSDEFRLTEGGLSRIWQKENEEGRTFAIIGSRDKDTSEDRYNELLELVSDYIRKHRGSGYKILEGKYTYKNGGTGIEYSLFIDNIPLEDALEIANKINQESIIYKDEDFFGFAYTDGTMEEDFPKKSMNFDDEAVQMYYSRILTKHNAGQKFVFEMYHTYIDGGNAVKNMSSKYLKEHLVKDLVFRGEVF